MRREGRTAFDYFNHILLLILGVLTLYPFWYVLVISISTEKAFYADMYHVIPRSFTLDTFVYALTNPAILRSSLVSVTITVLGTVLSMILTTMGAYVLSKKDLVGRNLFFRLIIFTMFFNGGLIPWYITVTSIGLRDTMMALFIPTAINTFNLILMKNYFTTIPQALEESAKIDGCNDLQVLVKVVIPTAKPIVATITLFNAVFFWNDFFAALILTSNNKLYPLSLVLRNMVLSTTNFMAVGLQRTLPDTIRAAVIIISIVPIMLVYPFIQKYFVQGIMLGSIKE